MRSMLRSQYEVAFWANAAAGARSASRAARSGVGLMVFMGFSSGLEAEADLELDFALVVAAGIGADDVEAVDGAAQPGGSEPVGGIHGRAGAVHSGAGALRNRLHRLDGELVVVPGVHVQVAGVRVEHDRGRIDAEHAELAEQHLTPRLRAGDRAVVVALPADGVHLV